MQDEEIQERLQERQAEIGRQIVHALAQPRHLMLHKIAILSIVEA
jgi:hypothetical protein